MNKKYGKTFSQNEIDKLQKELELNRRKRINKTNARISKQLTKEHRGIILPDIR